jgi:hypothetical protein
MAKIPTSDLLEVRIFAFACAHDQWLMFLLEH